MKKLKTAYKIIRSIVMAVIASVVILYILAYVVLSIPSVQNKIKSEIEHQCSELLGGDLSIKRFSFFPFSEAVLYDVTLASPSGEKCASIGKLSAGVDLRSLISSGKIVFTYALISGLDANISQNGKDGPLNIQFLIDALSSKDKSTPPRRFDLKFRSVMVRDSKATYYRRWMIDSTGVTSKYARLSVEKLNMDVDIPRLTNDEFVFDIRNVSAEFNEGFMLEHLAGNVTYIKSNIDFGGLRTNDELIVNDLKIDLPDSHLEFDDMRMAFATLQPVKIAVNGRIQPSDFKIFLPSLDKWESKWDLNLGCEVGKTEIKVEAARIKSVDESAELSFSGIASNFNAPDSLEAYIKELNLNLSKSVLPALMSFGLNLNPKISEILHKTGGFTLSGDGHVSMADDNGEANLRLSSGAGNVVIDGYISHIKQKSHTTAAITLDATALDLGLILNNHILGESSFSANANIVGFDKNMSGAVDLYIDGVTLNGNVLNDIEVYLERKENKTTFSLDSYDESLLMSASGVFEMQQCLSLQGNLEVARLCPDIFGIKGPLEGSAISLTMQTDITAQSIDDAVGSLEINDFLIKRNAVQQLYLPEFRLVATNLPDDSSDIENVNPRHISLVSDWIDADIDGTIRFSQILPDIKMMLSSVLPSLMQKYCKAEAMTADKYIRKSATIAETSNISNDFKFKVKISGGDEPYGFFNLPVTPLSDVNVVGYMDSRQGVSSLSVDALHIRQGDTKLIKDSRLKWELDQNRGITDVKATTIYPFKKGEVKLNLDVLGTCDVLQSQLGIASVDGNNLKGNVGFNIGFSRSGMKDGPHTDGSSSPLAVRLNILPSYLVISGTPWSLQNGMVEYSGNRIDVNNLRVEHGDQYVRIDGKVSDDDSDEIKVRLNDINLDYIFGILNINNVTFGGMATGEIVGSKLLTKQPEAHTRFLRVKDFSYNGAVLGTGNLASDYEPSEKAVKIYAVVSDPVSSACRAKIGGGIWIARDSLSFSFDANRLNVALLKPFMRNFASDLKGLVSGKCKLFGPFSNLDLTGAMFADTLSLKLDFNNTWYHAGRDSITLKSCLIDIPQLKLYDSYGHSAEFGGFLRHNHFHDASFDFRIKNAKSILCYNTNENINPLWYGRIFASGSGQVIGRPGSVDVTLDMTTRRGSTFTFVLSDSENMDEYSFLTFTDRRKEMVESEKKDTVPGYLRRFMKRTADEDASSSDVRLSIRGSITQDALVTLVMDPREGDKITARGEGGLQLDYTSADNSFRIIGKYVLAEGNYNFTLQDIIIKNFVIRQGSSISFNGDPMDANLDIQATYRVNTNLTDLDKSFANDKELNRTNVPVDATLLVKGPLTQPDIDFDIELPTLTSDVERKVKSLVSTNDMMSRQIIYLLALNRFYTPEYTGNTSSGAEWSSMASSTISSQLSNMLSQMTDKISFAPSFRSDKGDFTDMEFDLALSSRLLNNRLLINGNFGYRDRNTSSTQFVGDFDLEYLLNRSGNLRLKAYNHFNDQNYYLRSALTTQGVGVLYRWDFDRLLRRKQKFSPILQKADIISTLPVDSLVNIKDDSK